MIHFLGSQFFSKELERVYKYSRYLHTILHSIHYSTTQSTILNMIQHYTMMFGILQYFVVTSTNGGHKWRIESFNIFILWYIVVLQYTWKVCTRRIDYSILLQEASKCVVVGVCISAQRALLISLSWLRGFFGEGKKYLSLLFIYLIHIYSMESTLSLGPDHLRPIISI